MSGAKIAGIEVRTAAENSPSERRVGRSWKGAALTVLRLCAALGIEDGVRTHRLGHCRRVLSILSWHSLVSEICAVRGIVIVPRRARHCLSRRV